MLLKTLLSDINYSVLQGDLNIDILNICWDSRKVTEQSLFICTIGKNVDRHIFADSAVASGAKAILVEHPVSDLPKNITVIKTDNSRLAFAKIVNKFFDVPSDKFNLIGITGTKGKTSVSYYIERLLQSAGRTTGIIGTIENRIGSKKLKTEKLNPTTPDPLELQLSFMEMCSEQTSDVVMEVSSSALSQHRVDGCKFNIGVFTNLTHDHLEEHGTMENYKHAKMKLFRMCDHGVINVDDPYSKEFIANATCDILTFGIENEADLKAENIFLSLRGCSFTLSYLGKRYPIVVKVPGKFTIYNILACIGACLLSEVSIADILKGLKNIEGVKGRFETISNNKELLIIIDYAHTPDSLKNILEAARPLTKNKLITVFGCGGDRDKLKRPIMGELAGNLSDFCILTSDNPRTESPLNILKEIEIGIKKTACTYTIIENRKEAIIKALKGAETGDTVIIAGKGHEAYQIIGSETYHFDDSEVVQEALNGI
jgi:UDP-N-acetylmuramoyl-L-alanyl-D-glutamate--2,6-diaminopimelate ligase